MKLEKLKDVKYEGSDYNYSVKLLSVYHLVALHPC